MKKFLLITALSLISSSSFAAWNFHCTDTANNRGAGKISVSGNRVQYFKTKATKESWLLIVQNNGIVYNNDVSYQYGDEFPVGEIELVVGNYKLTLEGRELFCKYAGKDNEQF